MNSKHVGLVNILLVEDNPGDIRLIKESLKENKIITELTVLSDGEAALEYLKKTADADPLSMPDIILLDLNIPRLDGREVLIEVKKDERLRKIPVIVLTSSNEEEDVLKSYQNYANCFISKPIELDSFIKVMKSIENFWLTIVKLPA